MQKGIITKKPISAVLFGPRLAIDVDGPCQGLSNAENQIGGSSDCREIDIEHSHRAVRWRIKHCNESGRVIAEDLGTITPDVHELRDELGLPGMRVLQFAFGGAADNTHLPHNYVSNTVVYSGTHDNDTVVGWSEDGKYALYELIENGRTGYLVPPGDAPALAACVTHVLEAMPERAEIGRAAQQWARERFSLTRHVAEMTSIYDAAVGDHS